MNFKINPSALGKAAAASLLSALLATTASAHDNVPARAQVQPVTIVGATIHTVSGDDIRNGRVRFEDGRIVAVGGSDVSTDGSQIIDASGQQLYPGYIAVDGTLGLSEVSAVRATVDVAEVGANNADVRADTAFNADSEIVPVTRANGVLLALSVPGSSSGNVISGRSALMQLDGWTQEDMLVKAPVALHVNWPGGAIPSWLPPPAQQAAREAQKTGRATLRSAFEAAKRYAAGKSSGKGLVVDRRLEAMLDAVEGRQPVFFQADDAQSIQESLDFAREFGLKAVIVGGADAWQLTDALKAQDVPVILSGLNRLPRTRDDAIDSIYSAPAKLAAAGVEFAISNGGGGFATSNLRNLPYQAAAAVGFGLTPAQALRAITLTPARILGVDDRYGSIGNGLSATLFLADGDALEPATRVTRAWIDGREIDLSSRHTRLYDKYRQKYPETRDTAR
ncbi:MAG: amidohydrolase family protein [Xanthomonadales bacterium]|nr:amidohydrolase family protein [Xanthomonadales bacterium]